MTKKHWLRAAEFSLLVLVLVWYGVFVSSHSTFSRYDYDYERYESYEDFWRGAVLYWQKDWFDLLLLLAVAVSLIVLRPLTTPNASMRQRYAVVGFILGAGLVWYSFRLRWVDGYDVGPDPIWVLLIVALLASAGYLRIGWPRSGAQRVPIGTSGPKILASTDDGDKRGGGTGE